MSKETTIEVIAPSVEEALQQGLKELGLTAADVSVEVLDSGGKGFLGFGQREVRVKLTVNGAPKDEEQSPAQNTSDTKADPEQDTAKKNTSVHPKTEVAASSKEEPLLERSEEIVNKLLELMHLEASATARYDDPDREGRKSVYLDVKGKDLGVLIGRRGKTIEAFQRIAALIISKEMSRWVRVSIDVEGHRSRREQQLQRMAKKIAQQVASSGQKQSLEPMPPNERRIVHMTLQNSPDVKTNSIGEDTQRKVVVEPKN
ncbi:MAG: protein jag [Anaerolineae bacterium]|jgi:spoIIIJ-associated protein|nr:protein jag [Anaerolineae bacterium]MBT7073668.1 protein jag [Anaerolineae bacterium]MBT7781761.1 protein jag [Anaerolineae bacterium]